MSAAALCAQQITESLLRIAYHARGRLTHDDWDVIEEAVRRVKQHERLVREVLPDLRLRLAHMATSADPDPSA